MRDREIHLECLMDRCVLNAEGKSVGRIEEVRVQRQGEHWMVQEYLLGRGAMLKRISAQRIGLKLVRLLGAHKLPAAKRVPWDKLDLSDPERPRLLCSEEELETI